MNHHRFVHIGIIAFLFIWLVIPAQAQEVSAIPAEVQENVRARVDNGDNVGIVVGLIDADGPRYFSYGKMALTEERTPDAQTVFEIGSISKVFTALLLAQMVEEGRMHPDDPIANYLPDSVRVSSDEAITLAHLTTHTSGLPRLPDNLAPADMSNPYADYTVEQLYTFLSNHTPARAPGGAYEYSNLATGLLGHILARHTGKSYETLVIERIAEPLGMDDTRITLTADQRARLATGHSGGSAVSNWDLPTLAGAGALRSTAEDMLRFVAANLGLQETLLYAAMQRTHTPRDEAGSADMQVGMGWHIRTNDTSEIVWHNGGTGGYRSFAGFNEAQGQGVVVLANNDWSVDDIGFYMLDSTYALKEITPVVSVDPDVLERYVGRYQLAPTFIITITRDGDQLTAQATGQPSFAIYPSSETEFFLKVVEAQLTFNVAEDGTVESLTLHQNGQQMPAQKIE